MTHITPKWKKIIQENPVAFATLDLKGNPNVIPVSSVKVIDRTTLLITDNYMHTTKQNLHEHPRVSLAVWDKDWHGCKLIGTAKYYSTGKWKQKVEGLPDNKGFPAKGAIVVRVKALVKLA